ncbi:DUF4365 domain-containing protein [Nocardioides okcheonensis]|uniref:DUF4365 domain-containing protein n=1 Tax=Nocardioides okcheonensis TaxID=2894081 RepID=UPI001E4C5189|nr:DUF4365 domain-containing protein [Nocardioides okcheonensis]UFN44549.1 DUF4365 domain-containing protein [Nocardioides okcheonensis]
MSDQMGELGVAEFTRAALRLGWKVRRQHESDQGIDAQIEKVNWVSRNGRNSHEETTGRLIAVQIKSGKSWFRSKTPAGWWFSFSERERNLWLNHALPVIVAMYHPELDRVYWQRISASTITKARTKYRVEVPANQTVDMAGSVWDDLAAGHERRALDVFELSLQGIPPGVAVRLRERPAKERPDAALLAMHLAEGRKNAAGTATSLLSAQPRWITDNAGWAWGIVGQYCSEHGLTSLAADAFELSADANGGDSRVRSLVAAATHRYFDDAAAANDLVRRAEDMPGEQVLRAVGRTVVAGTNDRGHWTVDSLLLQGGPEVEGSAPAQRLLCVHARMEERFDDAVHHGEAALRLDPLSSETMVMTADSLQGRWVLGGAASKDLSRCVNVLEQALDQRVRWAGKVDSIRAGLVRALEMAGDYKAAMRVALPPPAGDSGTADIDAKSVRLAAYAANRLGDSDALHQALELLGDEPDDQLAKVRCGALALERDEETALRMAALSTAETARDFSEIGQHCLELCADGVNVIERLRPHVESGVLPASLLRLCEAIVTIPSHGIDASLPALRELALSDRIAAEYLLGNLRLAKRYGEAAEQAKTLFERTKAPDYLMHQARALIGADDYLAASEVAKVAVAVNDIREVDRAEMFEFLGQCAGQSEDWALAESYFDQAIGLHAYPSPTLVWNLVACQVNQARIARAADSLRKHSPPVRNRQDAYLWTNANNASVWDERTAFEAFALAQRFIDDARLSTALVTAIVTRTHGVGNPDEDDDLKQRRLAAQDAVPGELHKQAFELIQELIARHGDATGLRILQGEDETDLLDRMMVQLKEAAEADEVKKEVAELVRQGRVPVGLLARVVNRSTATLEAQRALGARLAASQHDDEHQLEVDAAASALNKSVIVDSATIITLAALSRPDTITGRFLAIRSAPATMLDLHRFRDDVRGMAGSPGSMHWDETRGRVVITELTDDEFMRLLRRSEAVSEYIDRLSVRSPGKPTVYADLHDDDMHSVWIDPIQLAEDEGLTLWSDDLGLRRAARAVGVIAFGTPALLDALRDTALRAAGHDHDAIDQAVKTGLDWLRELAADHIVDLPLPAETVYTLAADESWNPMSSAAVALSRGSFWIWTDNALTLLMAIYAGAREQAEETLMGWQSAAMYGAASNREPEAAASLLAILALVAFGGEPTDEERADSLRRARQVATELGVPDPAGGLPSAAALLAEGGAVDDAPDLVRRVLAILEEVDLSADDRDSDSRLA